MEHISVTDFEKIIKSQEIIVLDVRTDLEINLSCLKSDFKHIPLDQLEVRFSELNLKKPIYCLCHHGVRSQYAASFLDSIGAIMTYNVEGGIDAYAKVVDSSICLY